jgi:hypothetical protein
VPISKTIRARTNYRDVSAQKFAQVLEALYSGLTVSPHFPKPPVPLPVLRAKLNEFKGLIIAGLDSKNARLQRDSVRRELEEMFTQEAHYVSHVAEGDVAIFRTSNLEEIPMRRATPQPLVDLVIKKVTHGENSGTVKLSLPVAGRQIKMFQVSVREADSAGQPKDGRLIDLAGSKGPVRIDGLTPGKRYVFQVRGQNPLGFSDWSPAVTIIAI